jgi:hypothetical protein
LSGEGKIGDQPLKSAEQVEQSQRVGPWRLESAAARFARMRARLEIIDVNGRAGAICPLPASPSD